MARRRTKKQTLAEAAPPAEMAPVAVLEGPPPELPPEVAPKIAPQIAIGGEQPSEIPPSPAAPQDGKPVQALLHIKRTINSPHHLRRRLGTLDDATAKRLAEGKIPGRRFVAGARLWMSIEDVARYGLQEGFDYKVVRVRFR